MEAMVRALRRADAAAPRRATRSGGRSSAAFALVDGGRIAVVEMAQASGLWRIAGRERDARGGLDAVGRAS